MSDGGLSVWRRSIDSSGVKDSAVTVECEVSDGLSELLGVLIWDLELNRFKCIIVTDLESLQMNYPQMDVTTASQQTSFSS